MSQEDEALALIAHLSEFMNGVFTDQAGRTYLVVSWDGCHMNILVDGLAFEKLLIRIAVQTTGLAPKPGVVRTIRRTLYGAASERRELHQRVVVDGDGILIDLGREDWAAVKVDCSGWLPTYPEAPPFIRGATTGELPIPETFGSMDELDEFIPVDDDVDLLLIKIWMVAALIPDIPRPFLNLYGLRGSGKTETSRGIQALIDPQTIPGCHLPGTTRNLVVALKGSYLCLFDNVRSIPPLVGDVLCQSITDFGSVNRKLFTDSMAHVQTFRRTAIMTGLDVPTLAPDLLSRCLLIEFTGSSKLKSMDQWKDRFRAARPRILGSMLDTLSRAMQIHLSLETVAEIDHRLMDWVKWGVACGLAMGKSREEVVNAIQEMIYRQHIQVTGAQPIAIAIRELMRPKPFWRGSPTELFAAINPLAKRIALHKEPAWPKSVAAMGKALRAVVPELQAVGIEVTPGQNGKYHDRYFEIRRIGGEQPYQSSIRAIS